MKVMVVVVIGRDDDGVGNRVEVMVVLAIREW